MGMIAFYAGLVVGTLLGVIILSLIAMGLTAWRMPELPDRADAYYRGHADSQV
jgi:hypothetical protein